jgi:fumarate hydratase class I
VIGLGIGGSAEKAMLLAKEAVMDEIDMTDLLAARSRQRSAL